MSQESIKTKFELPESIKDCLPCQQKVIASHLITLCKMSKELSSEVDCIQLADDLRSRKVKTEEVIQTIADHSTGKSVEEAVSKMVHILDKKE